MTISKEDERTPGRKNAPSIVDVARRGWDVARRSAKMSGRSSCGPWEELPKEMQDALAKVATEGWLQGTQEGQEWARKGSYDNAPTDPHHGGKIFEPTEGLREWRDIETAPRDGTEILTFSDRIGLGNMVLYWADGYWREKANGLGLKYEPTHWQPLPPTPTEARSALEASNKGGE
jgi:hypothetical protein